MLTTFTQPYPLDELSQSDLDMFQVVFGMPYQQYLSSPSEAALFSCTPPLNWSQRRNDKTGEIEWEASLAVTQPYHVTPSCDAARHPELQEIATRLLIQLGESVNIPVYLIPYCGAFAQLGKFIIGEAQIRRPGANMQCHANASRIYRSGEFRCRIMTGFALSSNGQWNAHTWLVCEDGRVVESTYPYSAYFGVELSRECSDRFSNLNSGNSKKRKYPRVQRTPVIRHPIDDQLWE